MPSFAMTDDQIAHLCAADTPTELITRFWRDIALPRYGDTWDNYNPDRRLPVTHYAIPEHQWRAVCDYANTQWDFQGGMTWVNVGPSSI